MTGELKKEIMHWKFIDDWNGCRSWINETHKTISFSTDSSDYVWGAVENDAHASGDISEYWSQEEIHWPIIIKEAKAVYNLLQSRLSYCQNSRIDIHCDNLPVIQAWESQKTTNFQLIQILKDIFQLAWTHNILLSFIYVPSKLNPADAPSRRLSKMDDSLTKKVWEWLDWCFGGKKGHTLDLFALDVDAMCDRQGNKLPHFTPAPSPLSAGVNAFAQTISNDQNCYAFPPFHLVGPTVSFCIEQSLNCSLVFPVFRPSKSWVPKMCMFAKVIEIFSVQGDNDILLYPSKSGYVPDKIGLPCHLAVARFTNEDINLGEKNLHDTMSTFLKYDFPCHPFTLVLGDSIIRFLEEAKFHHSKISAISGGTFRDIQLKLQSWLDILTPKIVFLHVGTYNINKLHLCEKWQVDTAETQLASLVSTLEKFQACQHFLVIFSAVLHTNSSVLNTRVEHVNSLLMALHLINFILND